MRLVMTSISKNQIRTLLFKGVNKPRIDQRISSTKHISNVKLSNQS